jgi:hypothetical protein
MLQMTEAKPNLTLGKKDTEVFEQLYIHALAPTIFVVGQTYRLSSTSGQFYGTNNAMYFNQIFDIGILADSTIWIPTALSKPWEKDQNFQPFLNVDSLKPVLSDNFIYPLIDSLKYKGGAHKTYDTLTCSGNAEFVALTWSDSFPPPRGLYLADSSAPYTQQFYLMVYRDTTDKSDTLKAILRIHFSDVLDFSQQGLKPFLLAQPARENFLRGFIIRTQPSTGSLSFHWAGSLEFSQNKWILNYFNQRPPTVKTTNIDNHSTSVLPAVEPPVQDPEQPPKKKNKK